MNRQQRRRIERTQQQPPDNLAEFWKHPGLVVKRGELLGVVDKMIRLHELRRKRNRWYNRLRRWLDDGDGGRPDSAGDAGGGNGCAGEEGAGAE